MKKMKNSKKYFLMFIAVVFFLVIFLFFSACGLYLFERAEQSKMFESIPDAFVYVFLTMFTVGYGDVHPISLGGKYLSIIVAIIGHLIGLACMIGIILSTFRLGKVLRRIKAKN